MGRGKQHTVAALQRQVAALVRSVTTLEAELAATRKRVSVLEAENEELRSRLGVNSRNSSKPPSSDGPEVPKPPPRKPTGRKPGGQPGHDKRTRELVPLERVDQVVDHRPQICGGCAAQLDPTGGELVDRHQIWELPEIQAKVVEHRTWSQCCPNCQHITVEGLPAEVPRGVFGPRLMAVLAVLSGRYRLTRREAVSICESLFNIPISLGSVAKICATAGRAFGWPVAEVKAAVRRAEFANADETSFKCAGAKGWLWVVVVSGCTLFHLAPSRGADVIKQLLGEDFAGLLGTDRWSGYNWFDLARRQLCWAHIARNLQRVFERGGHGTMLGKRGVELTEEVFRVWHEHRAGPRDALRAAMRPVQDELQRLLTEHSASPSAKTQRFARELLAVWPALWTFVEVAGVEPTNNSSERAIRPAVLWRKGSFGTQGEDGVRFTEGILTIAATCKQVGRPLLQYVTELMDAHIHRRPAPRLLPAEA